MIKVIYTASFIRELKRIERKNEELYEEILEKINLFKNRKNHSKLRAHKLHGSIAGFWSFSINYKYRIIFEPLNKNAVFFHDIGDHDVYK
ncbi:MAG: Plasmid stabilization system [Parcubacteria group bacterium GW2011_GWA2_50_10b]|nr:MAG: Plasmid stabilization system [Parcubacteria group bacterium GW2011_GWA2_50_10b]